MRDCSSPRAAAGRLARNEPARPGREGRLVGTNNPFPRRQQFPGFPRPGWRWTGRPHAKASIFTRPAASPQSEGQTNTSAACMNGLTSRWSPRKRTRSPRLRSRARRSSDCWSRPPPATHRITPSGSSASAAHRDVDALLCDQVGHNQQDEVSGSASARSVTTVERWVREQNGPC